MCHHRCLVPLPAVGQLERLSINPAVGGWMAIHKADFGFARSPGLITGKTAPQWENQQENAGSELFWCLGRRCRFALFVLFIAGG